MTTEEMMKQVTNKDISYYGEEIIKKIYNSWERGIKNSEKQVCLAFHPYPQLIP